MMIRLSKSQQLLQMVPPPLQALLPSLCRGLLPQPGNNRNQLAHLFMQRRTPLLTCCRSDDEDGRSPRSTRRMREAGASSVNRKRTGQQAGRCVMMTIYGSSGGVRVVERKKMMKQRAEQMGGDAIDDLVLCRRRRFITIES